MDREGERDREMYVYMLMQGIEEDVNACERHVLEVVSATQRTLCYFIIDVCNKSKYTHIPINIHKHV